MLIVGTPGIQPVSIAAAAGTPDFGLNTTDITVHSQVDGTHYDITADWDFGTAGHVDDWIAHANTTLSISGGALICTLTGSPANNIIGARSAFVCTPSRMDFEAQTLAASNPTINTSCNVTTFDGSNFVAPSPAHGMTWLWSGPGRLFVVNGSEGSPDYNSGIAANTFYTGYHTWTTGGMTDQWSVNGNTVTYTGALTLNEARIMIGSYLATNHWRSISIRGIFPTV